MPQNHWNSVLNNCKKGNFFVRKFLLVAQFGFLEQWPHKANAPWFQSLTISWLNVKIAAKSAETSTLFDKFSDVNDVHHTYITEYLYIWVTLYCLCAWVIIKMTIIPLLLWLMTEIQLPMISQSLCFTDNSKSKLSSKDQLLDAKAEIF